MKATSTDPVQGNDVVFDLLEKNFDDLRAMNSLPEVVLDGSRFLFGQDGDEPPEGSVGHILAPGLARIDIP
jgi:hypothetical protein